MSPAPIRIPSSAKTAPLAGISSAKIHQISCACGDDRVVAGEGVRDHVAEREQHAAEDRAERDRPADHPQRRGARPGRVAGAEHPADHHLPGDRQRVEHEREEHEQLERDLVRAERRRG